MDNLAGADQMMSSAYMACGLDNPHPRTEIHMECVFCCSFEVIFSIFQLLILKITY